jgi:hypothetical protein
MSPSCAYRWQRLLMRGCFLLVLILVVQVSGQTQLLRKTWDYAVSILMDTASAERSRFIAYPTIAFTPETSWEFGVSTLLVYHARQDTSNRLSELNAFAFVTLEQQYGLWLDHALYSDQNDWFFLGRLRYQHFPLRYYGIGSSTPSEHTAIAQGDYLLWRERILRRTWRSFYMGLQIDYQRLDRARFRWTDPDRPQVLPSGAEGTANLGLGLGIVYDQRYNVLNVREGFFGEIAWLAYRPAWWSDRSFSTTFVDLRYFIPVVRREVLALQGIGVFTRGNPPFNQLALIGGETMMRGYYLGRYRDMNLAAIQAEYRWLPFAFSRRWGAAVFCSSGGVFGEGAWPAMTDLRLAGGGGVRFLLFPRKDIYTRFDFAFTREGTGMYFYIGEAF